MRPAALACTGDPLLDELLRECESFTLMRQPDCERAADALPLLAAERPDLIFTSPALGDVDALLQVKGPRICWLAEGSVPAPPRGVDVLRAERLTAQLIDAWVRRQKAAASRQAPPPPVRPLPPPARQAPGRSASPVGHEAGGHGGLQRAADVRPQPPGAYYAAHRAPRPAIRVVRQQVIAFWGGKPGAGRSTLALGLADLLARSGDLRVCTVDLNPYNSSLAPLLGREQEVSSWVHAAEAMARGQPLPEDGLHWIRPNWALVSGPDGRPDLVTQVTPEAIAWLVDGLRSQFDYIILDPEARPGPIRDSAARLAQLVLVTVTCDYPDVLDTARGFEAAVAQGALSRDRCRLVLSRWLDTPYLTKAEVADCFGLPVAATVPLSPEAALHAGGGGQPVTRLTDSGAARLTQALEQLLGVVAPALAAAGAERARSGPASPWMGWLSR